MFVQALAAYAKKNLKEELFNIAYDTRPVPYFIDISKDGRFLTVIQRIKQIDNVPSSRKNAKSTSVGQDSRVPRSPIGRNNGEHPLLCVDDIGYVLGLGSWKAEKPAKRINELHHAFVELIRLAAKETQDEALSSVCKFYDQPDQVEAARKRIADEGANGKSTVALQVSGEFLTDRPTVADWWRRHYKAKRDANKTKKSSECLISGDIGKVPLTHLQIKHMTSLGGQSSGVSLMSFDKPAFTSYGWKKNANSSVSEDSQSAYVLALNHLLNPHRINPESIFRKDLNDVAFIFWLRSNSPINPAEIVLEQPSDQKVSSVARLLRAEYAEPDPNRFYMAALSATGARLVVRTWVTETLPVVLRNVQEWWSAIEIQHPSADQVLYAPSLKAMLAIFRRKDSKDEQSNDDDARESEDGDKGGKHKKQAKPGIALALFSRAIMGSQSYLGPDFLAEVMSRIKSEVPKRSDIGPKSKQESGKAKRVEGFRTSPTAMSLVRLCLNDRQNTIGKGAPMPASLDEDTQNQAYLCGRLLATYDSIQYFAFTVADETVPNSIVSDRFYHMMMTSPAIAISSVSELGTAHLKKLKRCGDRGRALSATMEQQIASLYTKMGTAPPEPFDIYDRARFVLGFYQQKYRPKKTGQPTNQDLPDFETTSDTYENPEVKGSDQ